MGSGRRVGRAANPTASSEISARMHLTEIGDRKALLVVNDSRGLPQHVTDAIVAIIDLTIVRRRAAGKREGILHPRQPKQIVVSKELGVAARVAGWNRGTGALVVNGGDVIRPVEVVGERN